MIKPKILRYLSFLILIVLAIFLLTGCKSIDYGIVTNKSFSPAHTVYSPIVMIINKQTRIIPRYVTHPDLWRILVENDDGSEWWTVSKDFYDSVEIGDSVDRRDKP